jgi:hypothetical protein
MASKRSLRIIDDMRVGDELAAQSFVCDPRREDLGNGLVEVPYLPHGPNAYVRWCYRHVRLEPSLATPLLHVHQLTSTCKRFTDGGNPTGGSGEYDVKLTLQALFRAHFFGSRSRAANTTADTIRSGQPMLSFPWALAKVCGMNWAQVEMGEDGARKICGMRGESCSCGKTKPCR